MCIEWLGILLGLTALPGDAGAKERAVVDRIAAVIENEVITQRELEAKAEPYLQKLEGITDPVAREEKRKEIWRQVLDIEIDERIVDAEIERSKERLGVTDKDVDRAVQEVLRMNSLTEDQLKAALYSQGLTWSEYRKKLQAQIERARLIQFRVQGRVQIKDEDVKRRCIERHRSGATGVTVCAAHILKKIPPQAGTETIEQLRAAMSKLQAELSSGADFSAYALKHSEDTGAPDGDIGCFGKGEMVEPFEQAAFALTVGEVSPVIRSPFGFHIIKVYDRRMPSTGECANEEVLSTFRNELYQAEMERQMQGWLRELRSKAFVEIRI